MRNQQMSVEIKDGRLEISIGVDLMCHAITHGPCQDALEITDNDMFAGEVLRALKYEEEDGTNPVHRMLDAAAEQAIEDGAEGCEID